MAKLEVTAVKLGLEKILEKQVWLLKGLRVGLVCNPASVDHQYRHAADLFYENSNINLTTLFGPQHGIRGDVQDNMVETGHIIDSRTEIPIYSLYSETREPTEDMLSELDVLVFDLQDVGCRVYTFIYTMANCMKACARYGKKMIVLDRPNPINGTDIEGNLLEIGHESFVGMFPIPMRHGMTVGELAMFFNSRFELQCELEVVSMDGWNRRSYADETDAPWAMPSPNMPTINTAVVFPATVYFEGTQISEGRGTTRPFEIVGAPYIDAQLYADALTLLELPGTIFRAINFLPTFQKYAGQNCGGVFLHVAERNLFEPVITGLAMIKTIFDLYPENFEWKNLPYEYEFDRNPFDVIAGTLKIRKFFEEGKSISEIKDYWQNDLIQFSKLTRQYLLY